MKKGILQVVTQALPKIRQEHERLDRKYGIRDAIDISDKSSVDRMLEPNQQMLLLQGELMTYPLDELVTLETYMYYGRDEEPRKGAFNDLFSILNSRGESKKIIITTILDKSPDALERYFKDAAWKLFQAEGLTPDKLGI